MPPSPYTNFRLPPRRKAANENNILLKKWEQNTGYHPYDPKRNGTRKAQTAPNWLKNAIRTQNSRQRFGLSPLPLTYFQPLSSRNIGTRRHRKSKKLRV